MGCHNSEDTIPAKVATAPSTLVAQVDPGPVHFVDVAKKLGLNHEWPQQPRPMRTPDAFGSGCAFLDFDQDGWQDVLLVCNPHPKLYRNVAGTKFEDVTLECGLTKIDGNWTGCAVGDYDGDGLPDMLLTGIHCLALFKNMAGNRFEETTVAAGLDRLNHGHWGASAGFMDLDGDQHLDLVILNYVAFGPESKQYCVDATGVRSGCPPYEYPAEFGEIWRNTGQGRFEVLPQSAGMAQTQGVGLVLAFTDLDKDGRMDFYIGNDAKYADLMHNLGGMRFENIGHASGVAAMKFNNNFTPMAAMGADFADYDRDGRLDLTVTNFQELCFTIFRNMGDSFFSDVGGPTGISAATRDRLGFGAKWLDLDNDAWPDICFVNGHVYDNAAAIAKDHTFRQSLMLFHNLRGEKFVDIVPDLSEDVGRPLVGRGSATGDFNNDGLTDLLIVDFEGAVMLLKNCTQNENHWITFDLRGQAPNVLAYGAKVTARVGDQVWVLEVSPTSSYLSASDPRIHFGLGKVSKLETVSIRWPDGGEEVLTEVATDQILRVFQGASTARQ